MKPIQLDLRTTSLEEFKNQHAVERVIDAYSALLEDLFLIRNPHYRFDKNYQSVFESFQKSHIGERTLEQAGNWFYFPWNKLLVHYLPDKMHQELRTARNKNLITSEEQKKFYHFTVGIVGLSVGSHAATTLVMMGGCRAIKIADPDEISGSNLNRIRRDFTDVGEKKCDIVERYIYQINPYAEVYAYPMGIMLENIKGFLAGPPKLDVLVEQLDNLEMKIRLRLAARKLGVPVVMATDNGDNVIIDVERYDLDSNLELFNGVLGKFTLEEFQKFRPQDLPRLATKIAGPSFVVPRMLGSLLEVGKTLYSWPQLGDAATLSGVAMAYVIKRLAIGEKVRTGKFDVSLDAIFDPEYDRTEIAEKREIERKNFLSALGL